MRWIQVAPLVAAVAFFSPCEGQPTNGCMTRMVMVNVRDGLGRLVTGLTLENFKADSAHSPIKITSAQIESGPRRSIVLLDASGSMGASKSKWQGALLAAREIVSASPADETIQLFTFTEQMDQTGNVETTREDLLGLIRTLEDRETLRTSGHSRTSLADAISAAASKLVPARRGDSIWVITDGEDNQSRIKLQTLERQLALAGLRLFPIILQSHQLYGMNYDAQDFMDLANATGGLSLLLRPGLGPVDQYDLRPESASHISQAVQQMVSQHRSFYLLEIETQQPVKKRQQWALKVVDQHGKEVRGTTVVYPRVLQSCGSN